MEIRILDLSVVGFTFRLPLNELPDHKGLRLAAYMLKTGTSEMIEPENYVITKEADRRFWSEYRLETTDEKYSEFVRRFMDMYYRYSQLKMEEDYNGIAEEFLRYSIPEDSYCSGIEEQRAYWYRNLQMPENIQDFEETAIALSAPNLISEYLRMPLSTFLDEYYARRGLEDHPVVRQAINCVYIGNQYCDILRPSIDVFRKVIEKARSELLRPVICFAPVPERRIEDVKRTFEYLIEEEGIDEVVVNDWGILSLLESEQVEKTLGILLCKRRKDPRMNQLNSRKEEMKETSIDSSPFRKYLSEHFAVRRYSYECTESYVREVDSAVLHWPMIQLNTSGTCALRAACLHNDRAMQSVDDSCEMYCLNHHFFYPKEMNMIGKYNSLFECRLGKCGTKAKRLVIELP